MDFATLKAAWSVLRSAIGRGQLFRPYCVLVEPDPYIFAENAKRD